MSTPITPDERAAMRARVEAATHGPWEPDEEGSILARFPDEDDPGVEALRGVADRVRRRGDATFIAAARTDVPRLLDALDAAESEIARLREGAETLRGRVAEHEETIIETSDALDEAARRAPAWDEDTVLIEAGRAALDAYESTLYDMPLDPTGATTYRPMGEAALAVARDHLPVKPSREDVMELLYENRAGYLDDIADALLNLWPGESRTPKTADRD